MLRPIYIYTADDGTVSVLDNYLYWEWDNGDSRGTEVVPIAEAEDYFRGVGRDDIAGLIVRNESYEYGHICPLPIALK